MLIFLHNFMRLPWKLAGFILLISHSANGVVLIDEIENGFHHSVMVNVWKAIGMAAREFNTQIFATTHNMECIRAAHEAFSESDPDDFRLHRLEEIDGDIQVKTINHEIMDTVIDRNLEIR